jgi:penicillin-binding protein 2
MNRRGKGIRWVCVLCAAGMGVRLGTLMLGKEVPASAATEKYERQIVLQQQRGDFYDRNMQPLTSRQQGYLSIIQPQYFVTEEKKEELSQGIGGLWGLEDRIEGGLPFSFWMTGPTDLPGILQLQRTQRYSENFPAIHLLGYTDGTGRYGLSGLEKVFDDVLGKGETITMEYEGDAAGHVMEPESIQIQAGGEQQNLTGIQLTLDRDVQEIVTKVAREQMEKGAIVVMDVASGEIVAMESMPAFDPQRVSGYLNSDQGELLNRALLPYSLGSIFKIVVATAAMEEGICQPEGWEMECTGSITVGDVTIKCHKEEGHGVENMKEAFAGSCNPFFIQLGQKIGAEKLLYYAKKLGIGTGVELNGITFVEGGNLPEGKNMPPAGVANLSIGQGELSATPLEVCRLFASVANGGILKHVNLLMGEVGEDGTLKNDERTTEDIQVISKINTKNLQEMLRYVVTDGTGNKEGLKELQVAGKTSSAEWVEGEVHGWFGGYFPYENPKYAMVVFCEDGKSGTASAIPIFSSICKELEHLEKE